MKLRTLLTVCTSAVMCTLVNQALVLKFAALALVESLQRMHQVGERCGIMCD